MNSILLTYDGQAYFLNIAEFYFCSGINSGH